MTGVGVGWGVGMIRMGVLLSDALELPGAANNFVSTPDSVANSISDDIELRAWVRPVDWTPSAAQFVMAKVNPAGAISWQWSIEPDGKLRFMYGNNPSGFSATLADSTAATGFTDDTDHWLQLTRRKSDGRIQFSTSTDGSSWTPLGSDVVTGAGQDMTDTDGAVTIGARSDSGGPYAGLIRYAEVRDGIGGPVVHSFDPAAVTKIGTRDPSTVAAGGPWTVNGTLWDWVLAP